MNAVAGMLLAEQHIVPRSEQRFRTAKRIVPAALLFTALLAQLCVRLEIVRAGYQLEEYRARATQSDTTLRELRYKYAITTSPSTLGDMAKKRLEFERTPPQRIRKMVYGSKAE